MIKPGMFISDRYEIIEKVGSGGMADVYKARCHRLNRFVAIKVLKSEFSDDKSFVNKFRAEAQSAAGLSHPNIVNVYDVGDDDGLYYIVMELVEGITLKSFIERKGKLEVREAVGISIQIAQGMEAAHANHIIHRDIKPQNIIISREGKVKVTDFGIAKAASSNTITSNAMGSVHYISPEQARGGYSDERSDIYSLGITIYEMLSGMVPFAGDNTVSVAILHVQGEAMPLRQIDGSIPVSLEKIVQKCMQKKPEFRYSSASELIVDLKKSLTNPNGDFVVMAPFGVDSSPTINISDDEVSSIKNATNKVMDHPTEFDEVEEEEVTDVATDASQTDEEGGEEVNPKLEKIMMGAIIGIVAIICIIGFVLAGQIFGFFGGGGSSDVPIVSPSATASIEPTPSSDVAEAVKVPSVIGKSLEDAQKLLEGLTVRYTEQSSESIDKDYVIDQDIDAGEEVEAGSIINLIISTGAESVTVENVYGKKLEDAKSTLDAQGLLYKVDQEYSDSVESGYVTRTSPEKGSSVTKGDTITIYVSKGAETKYGTVPDLSDMTKAEAKRALEEQGLKLGEITKAYSNTVAVGQISAQEYKKGTALKEGSTVDVTISLGVQPTQAPTKAPTYEGIVKITDYPEGFESGEVVLKVTLNNTTTSVNLGNLSAGNFPYTYTITGSSAGTATVVASFNNVDYGTYSVKFVEAQ